MAGGNNIAGKGDPSGARQEGEEMRARVTSPPPGWRGAAAES